MAFGRETIGRAYVKILADGSGLPESIKREIEDTEPLLRAQGQRNSEAYQEGFKNDFNEHFGTDLNAALNRGIGRNDAIENYFAGAKWKQQLDVLHEKFGDVGIDIGRDIEKGVRQSGDLGDVSKRLTNIATDITNSTRKVEAASAAEQSIIDAAHAKLEKDIHDTSISMQKNIGETASDMAKLNRVIGGVWDDIGKATHQQAVDFEKDLNRMGAASASLERDMARTKAAIEKGVNATHDTFTKANIDIQDTWKNIHEAVEETKTFDRVWETAGRDIEKRAARMRQSMRRFGKDTATLGDTMGRTFGKGARNNFFNLTGTIVGGIASIIQKLPFFNKSVGSMGDKLKEVFSGDGSMIAKMGGSIGAVLPELLTLGAVFAGILVIAGPIAALISGIVAALIALAGAVAFALASGIALLGAAFLTVAIGAGVAALAISGFNQKLPGSKQTMMDFIKEAAQPLTDAFSHMKDVAAGAVFPGLMASIPLVTTAFEHLTPLVKGVATGLGDILRQAGYFVTGHAWRELRLDLTDFLPGATADLGTIFFNVFGGLAGIIRAALPSVSTLLDNLVSVTGEFGRWANSPKGQRELGRFFDRAADSLEAVWGFLSSIVGAVAGLFSGGKETGDSLFDEASSTLQTFITFLDEHPDAVADWFANGKQIAEDIGNAIIGLGRIIDDLDSPTNRQLLHDFFATFQFFLDLLDTMKPLIELSLAPLKILLWVMEHLAHWIGELVGWLEGLDWSKLWNGITGITSTVLGEFTGLAGKALTAAGTFLLSAIMDPMGVLTKITTTFAGLAWDALKAVGKFLLASIIDPKGVFEAVVSPFRGLGSAIVDAIGDIVLHLGWGSNKWDGPAIGEVGQWPPRDGGNGGSGNGGYNGPIGGGPIGGGGGGGQIPIGGGMGGGGRVPPAGVTNNFTIITPAKDPVAVARETINHLAAHASYT